MERPHYCSRTQAGISAAAAALWLLFSVFWTRNYLYSHREAVSINSLYSEAMPRPSVPFHLGALIYQFFTIIFYTVNTLYGAIEPCSQELSAASWFMFSLYFSTAYIVGMSFSLGFGTIYARFPKSHVAVLTVTATLALAGCLAQFSNDDVIRHDSSTFLVVLFALQISIAFVTLIRISLRIKQCVEYNHTAYASVLRLCRRQMATVIFLFLVLFCAMALDLAVQNFSQETLWGVFVPTTLLTNGWVLVLMRPRPALMDAEMLEDSLKQDLNESQLA